MKNYTKRVKNKLKEKAEWECKMKINPIELGSYNSQYKGQNPNDSQNFKDSSQDSKKRQNFLDIMRETNTQQKEINNDSTNAISTNSATTPILTPTNPYGSGNGGNYRYNNEQSKQSAEISGNGRNDTATYNGGFTQLLGEKDDRNRNFIEKSQAESRESRSVGAGSANITRLGNAKAYTTAEERDRLDRLEKAQKFIKAYESALEPNKQHTKNTIKPKQSKQKSNDFNRGL